MALLTSQNRKTCSSSRQPNRNVDRCRYCGYAQNKHIHSIHHVHYKTQSAKDPYSKIHWLFNSHLCITPFLDLKQRTPFRFSLFHCLSTDRRPAPFHSYASQILSIALLCRSSPLLRLASPFHRFAIPGLASPFRCVAVPGSSIPYHRSTVQCLCFANLSHSVTKQFVAFPFLRISFPCLSVSGPG
jgi:hypothetical protein